MPVSGIKVLFILKSWDVPYEVKVCSNINNIFIDIAIFQPDVIVTSAFLPGVLMNSGISIRKRWIHVDGGAAAEAVAGAIESCYTANLWGRHKGEDIEPLVSVYTGTFNTGDFLRDTYQSLREQTYPNWEWVVIDDFSNDGTWERLLEIANEDFRVRPFRMKHVGKIGYVKDVATRLANGDFLVELDHDDMLVDIALYEIVKAFQQNPDIGMVYSNCASFFADGTPHKFDDDFWRNRYREIEYRGKKFLECINPDIYDRFGPAYWQQFGWFLTVGPNHVRAYRRDILQKLGGYNCNLPVADDWDVYARFFLYSKCLHLDKMLYLYRFHDGWSNTTFTRNKSIQDHLELGRRHYASAFADFNEKRIKQKVSVIVVDWNTQDFTERCLKSVKENYPDFELVLVQNGKHFDSKFADKQIRLEVNVGFAAACNRGALEASGDVFCFLNSDTVVERGLFEGLLDAIKQGAGAAGPYSNYAKEPQGNYPDKNSAPKHNTYLEMISGFCLMTPRIAFEAVGGFDTNFCNFEDDDYCRKIRNIGFTCGAVGGTWLYHEGHVSFRTNALDLSNVMDKSSLLYHKKWPKVAVLALTKDEMSALPGFFQQFQNKGFRFGIVDDFSQDGTADWARANGIEIISRKLDNFSNQRNFALDNLARDADWVLMFDPDERLDQNTLDNIFELLRSEEFDIFLSPLRSKNYDGTFQCWVPKPFLFRNSKNIRWVFNVHEKLIGSYKQALISNAMITHLLELHSPDRRREMEWKYDSLGQDGETIGDWPLLNYQKRDDSRIAKVVLGPLVSVIIPTYARRDLLQKAVESVFAQDYLSKEVIVIGDADPEFISIPGCRCLNLPQNHGAGGAVPRNYGLMLANGYWIAYLDDDNMWKREHLSSLFFAVTAKQADLGLASMEVGGKVLLCEKPEYGAADTSCLFHKRGLIAKAGWWKDRNEAGYAHDWEFISRLLQSGAKWVTTKNPTVCYGLETCGQKDFLKQKLSLA